MCSWQMRTCSGSATTWWRDAPRNAGKDLSFDLVAGRRYPAGDEAHDVGIGVQADQVAHVGHREPAQHQPRRFCKDVHRPTPSGAATLPAGHRPLLFRRAEPARMITHNCLPEHTHNVADGAGRGYLTDSPCGWSDAQPGINASGSDIGERFKNPRHTNRSPFSSRPWSQFWSHWPASAAVHRWPL